MRRRIALALILAIVAPLSLTAQTRQDGWNDGSTPNFGKYNVYSFGWFYTPSTSYWLTGIETYFSPEDPSLSPAQDRAVTVELLTAPRADGGSLLRSATFFSDFARGQLGGATFDAIELTAGTTYFLGFVNVTNLGANMFYGPEAYAPSDARYDWDVLNPVLYENTQDMYNQGGPIGPVVVFNGFADAPVVTPEPASIVLLGTGLAGIAGFAKRRRPCGLPVFEGTSSEPGQTERSLGASEGGP